MKKLTRELAARLYSAGYQAGHEDTVEGRFSDDPRGDDAEAIHGEAITEIVADFAIREGLESF